MHTINGAEEKHCLLLSFFLFSPVSLPRQGLPQSAVGLCWMLLAPKDVDRSPEG